VDVWHSFVFGDRYGDSGDTCYFPVIYGDLLFLVIYGDVVNQ
jgi:hypothetical protein